MAVGYAKSLRWRGLRFHI